MKYFLAIISCILCCYACHFNNIKIDPEFDRIWSKRKVRGGYMEMDNTRADFIVSDMNKDTLKIQANNSAALLYAMVALESGKVEHVDQKIQTQKGEISIRTLLQNPNTENLDAFATSLNDTLLQSWLNKLSFGNQQVLPSLISISVDEQIGFIKRFYFNQLPFSNRTHRLIKNVLSPQKIGKYQHPITLLGNAPQDSLMKPIWFLGWREKENTLHFFASYLETISERSSSTKIENVFLETIEYVVNK